MKQIERVKALETVDELISVYRAQGERLLVLEGSFSWLEKQALEQNGRASLATAEKLEHVRAVISDAISSASRRDRRGAGQPGARTPSR